MTRTLQVFAVAALLTASAFAAEITGTITNGTTGKPGAGVDVVLINLNEGMQEAGRTQAGRDGKFKFTVADANQPFLVRAVHQDVTYHRPVMPGTTTVDIEVFDAAEKVEGINVVAQVMRAQSPDGSRLEVAEMYTVRNDSKPPRTQFSDRSFEVVLPKEAQLVESMALGPGGTAPITAAPVPLDDKGRHGFFFPLRPGETRFRIIYNLPYSGEATLRPRVLYPAQHVVLVLPSSMQFTTDVAKGLYSPMQDSPGTNVQVATNVGPGQDLSFNLKGTGTIPEDDQAPAGAQQAQTGEPGSGPGGGMAPPTGTPTPLGQYQWWILGGLAIILAAGAFFFLKQTGTAPAASAGPTPPRSSSAVVADVTRPTGRDSLLIEALKEELFQLEMDKHRGNLSPEEYVKAKAALDLIIERAATRMTARV